MFGINNLSTKSDLYNYIASYESPQLVRFYDLAADNNHPQLDEAMSISESQSYNTAFPNKKRAFFQYLLNHDIIKKVESQNLTNCGFVVNFPLFLNIGDMVYSRNRYFSICAHLFHGAIYLSCASNNNNSTLKQHNINITAEHDYNSTTKQQNMNITAEHNNNENKNNNENNNTTGVFEMNLNQHKILYKVDSLRLTEDVYCSPTNTALAMIELNERPFNCFGSSYCSEEDKNFRLFKSRELTLKAFYGKCDNIIVDFFKNDVIKEYSFNEMVEFGTYYWKLDVILNFTNAFLTYIRNCFIYKLGPYRNLNNMLDMKIYFQSTPRQGVEECSPSWGSDWVPFWYAKQLNTKRIF